MHSTFAWPPQNLYTLPSLPPNGNLYILHFSMVSTKFSQAKSAFPPLLQQILSICDRPNNQLSNDATFLIQARVEPLPSSICHSNYFIQLFQSLPPPLEITFLPKTSLCLLFQSLCKLYPKKESHSTLSRKETDQANSNFLLRLK